MDGKVETRDEYRRVVVDHWTLDSGIGEGRQVGRKAETLGQGVAGRKTTGCWWQGRGCHFFAKARVSG